MAIRAEGPWPPLLVLGQNSSYAEMMLNNIGGIHSEMTSIAHYRYVRAAALDDNPALSDLFHQVSIVEMRHLDTFMQLALRLGADPRMWQRCGNGMKYWSPGYVDYHCCGESDLLQRLEEEEAAAVKVYQSQAARVQDPHLAAVLRRIIADEQEHVRLWNEMKKRV